MNNFMFMQINRSPFRTGYTKATPFLLEFVQKNNTAVSPISTVYSRELEDKKGKGKNEWLSADGLKLVDFGNMHENFARALKFIDGYFCKLCCAFCTIVVVRAILTFALVYKLFHKIVRFLAEYNKSNTLIHPCDSTQPLFTRFL